MHIAGPKNIPIVEKYTLQKLVKNLCYVSSDPFWDIMTWEQAVKQKTIADVSQVSESAVYKVYKFKSKITPGAYIDVSTLGP